MDSQFSMLFFLFLFLLRLIPRPRDSRASLRTLSPGVPWFENKIFFVSSLKLSWVPGLPEFQGLKTIFSPFSGGLSRVPGLPQGFPKVSPGFPWFSPGLPVFPWVFPGFSPGFPWSSLCEWGWAWRRVRLLGSGAQLNFSRLVVNIFVVSLIP